MATAKGGTITLQKEIMTGAEENLSAIITVDGGKLVMKNGVINGHEKGLPGVFLLIRAALSSWRRRDHSLSLREPMETPMEAASSSGMAVCPCPAASSERTENVISMMTTVGAAASVCETAVWTSEAA